MCSELWKEIRATKKYLHPDIDEMWFVYVSREDYLVIYSNILNSSHSSVWILQ